MSDASNVQACEQAAASLWEEKVYRGHHSMELVSSRHYASSYTTYASSSLS